MDLMILFILAGVVILVLLIVTVLVGRHRGWNMNLSQRLKVAILKKMGLYGKPTGQYTDHVLKRAKGWEAFKNKILLFTILPSEIGVVIWIIVGLFMGILDIVTPIILVVVVAAASIVAYYSLLLAYYTRYAQKPAWDTDLHESLTKGRHDHWSIDTIDELEPDDPHIQQAHKTIRDVLQRRRRERLREQEEAAQTRQRQRREQDNGNPGASSATPAATPTTTTTPAEPGDGNGEEETLPCPVCQYTEYAEDSLFCSSCGANLFPKERYFLVTRAFCAEDDPWRQFVVLTDTSREAHEQPLTREMYIGRVPVKIPASKVSLARVATIYFGASETAQAHDGNPPSQPQPKPQGNGDGLNTLEQLSRQRIPVVVFVDSKENIRRVTGLERPYPYSREAVDNAEDALDGYTSIEAGGIIRTQERRIKSVEGQRDHALEESGKEADELIEIRDRYGKPEEQKRRIPPALIKAGKYLLIAAVVIAFIAVFLVFILPFILNILWSAGAGAAGGANSTLSYLSAIMSAVTPP